MMPANTDWHAHVDESVIERFWAKVDRSNKDGCWTWTDSTRGLGYGRLYVGGRLVRAHRLSLFIAQGDLNPDLVVDHLCRNTVCVNPAHLEEVTNATNLLRGVGFGARKAQQTHCVQGHEFTPENTRIDQRGRRRCRACNHDRNTSAEAKAYAAAYWRQEKAERGVGDRNKLTEAQVREIFARWSAGEHQHILAREFGVSQSQVSNIASGRQWAHLELRKVI